MKHLFLVCVVLVPVFVATKIGKGNAKIIFPVILFLAGCLLTTILFCINMNFPYADGGDDFVYYQVSIHNFQKISDWFDLSQFMSTHEQSGYPLLLSWVHQICGESLFHRKALNLFFFLMLANFWYLIGDVIGGKRLGLVLGITLIIGTPLWFYWMFLLKDMTIVFLQSLLILGLIDFVSGFNYIRGYVLMFLCTIAVIPFRVMLVFVNLAFISSAILFTKKNTSFLLRFGVVISMIAIFFFLGNNPNILKSLGASGEDRKLEMGAIERSIERREMSKNTGMGALLKFPLLYLVGEVNTFNINSWDKLTPVEIRAMGMVPWIFFGLPLFLYISFMFIYPKIFKINRLVEDKLIVKNNVILQNEKSQLYFTVLYLFVGIYAGVSYLSNDTTRWRLAALPPMLALAGWGWTILPVLKRTMLLVYWLLSVMSFSILYYVFLKQ
ncbi:MAG: hypothetical protein PVI90_14530 [Desulfobacteraceae bacterium]|jgi:hypothetical protein